jgi:membrane associated rhomboid family serine protease
MDRATDGLQTNGTSGLPRGFDLNGRTPLDRPTAIVAISQADDLMEQNEAEEALALYSRATAIADRDVSAAGYYGVGNALYRLDRDVEARDAWLRATTFGETPVTYRAWRQVAAARVREGDLRGAVEAYRQCERRAPREDRAEIASRLGWLNKESGNTGAANRYFARSRGQTLPPFMTYLIIAVTVVTSLSAMSGALVQGYLNPASLEGQLGLHPLFVAHGEYYRLLSVTLVHDPTSLLHLLFNMYALWFAGQLVERMYGPWVMAVMYAVCGIAASAASFAFGPLGWSVGASGAIFGLFGVILVATRFHHAILDAQSRSIAGQIGLLIVINLAIGFSGVLNVDNYAHVGGLIAGLWLGVVLPPSQVQTLASAWQAPRGVRSPAQALALRAIGVAALVAVVGGVVAYGTVTWQANSLYRQYWSTAVAPSVRVVVSEWSSGRAIELVDAR